MKQVFRKKILKLSATLVVVGVFLCIAGPAMATGSHDSMTGSTSCQTMQVNFIAPTSDGRLFSVFILVLFPLFFIRHLRASSETLAQQTTTALGPPMGSRWRLFQHVFLDTVYRQFSPARQYAAVVVEPQTYSI